jgi:dGTPase
MVGFHLRDKKLLDQVHPLEVGMIVSAAALAHDIGNPPFGHSGEDAIQTWFKESESVSTYCKTFTPRQRADFEFFEGNAQGFRILTRLQMYKERGGMQLTAATLGTFSKYPVQVRLADESESTDLNLKKFGFFQSEKDRFATLADLLGLLPVAGDRGGWCRHPPAYLLEASDDVCYRIVDFEDGFQLGLIEFDVALQLLAAIGDKEKNLRRAENEHTKRDKIKFLRAVAIGNAIEEAARVFIKHLPSIMRGEFKGDLMSKTPFSTAFDKIKQQQVTEIYKNQRVLRVEAAGFTVIRGLLEVFFRGVSEVARAVDKTGSPNDAPREGKKIYDLIPAEFLGSGGLPHSDPYPRLLGITDYVCGMTDSFALNLFRNIAGISLP